MDEPVVLDSVAQVVAFLRKKRQARRIRQQDVADRCGLHMVHVSRLETNKNPQTRLDTLQKIAASLGYRLRVVLEPNTAT